MNRGKERGRDSVNDFRRREGGWQIMRIYEAFLKLRFIQDSILVPRNLYFYVKGYERTAC